ncbi:hypothetical protein SAMN06265348_11311 [Pedobacter westerhofensis]|uniref:Uncharacterized protein n=1 Tax=Pedobacter westerhofensis TaxID=425512 RepID=A0A521FIW7_9SPHI|nr:hypothetical protein [Pedobacter westerhofensis]SMO96147.1 hypothetical protein SAMN06265348_11311 [Pedobacter westerhofensis]
MKKFLVVCAVLFIVNMGCKKMNADGGGLCGCSPIEGPELDLVIRNAAGDDLLSDKTSGAYTKDNIQVYRKDENGKIIPIIFAVRPQFSYGDEKFKYNFLYISAIRYNQDTQTDVIYLKLADHQPVELTLKLKLQGRFSVQQLLADQKEVEKDNGTVAKFSAIYYLNR